jgi:hypothetical protein
LDVCGIVVLSLGFCPSGLAKAVLMAHSLWALLLCVPPVHVGGTGAFAGSVSPDRSCTLTSEGDLASCGQFGTFSHCQREI